MSYDLLLFIFVAFVAVYIMAIAMAALFIAIRRAVREPKPVSRRDPDMGL